MNADGLEESYHFITVYCQYTKLGEFILYSYR